MACVEYTRLAGVVESKRQAYAYIRLNEGRVHVSKQRYEELVSEGYTAMTSAMREFGWHRVKCLDCKAAAHD